MTIAPIDLARVAECRRELLTVIVNQTKGIRDQFPTDTRFADYRAACDEVLALLIEARAGRVEVEDELQLRLFERDAA